MKTVKPNDLVLAAIMSEADGRAYLALNVTALEETTGLTRQAVLDSVNVLSGLGKLQLILSVADDAEHTEH